VCPTFAECQYTSQKTHQHSSASFLTDAAAGKLPNFSIVTPTGKNSQHNNFSMLQGDNWIGQAVQAVMNGSDWSSTAIFITYDDCGCFYDHVTPPAGMGIRAPMVIVSPYARPGYTDSTTASYASMLAFTEHLFGLQPLTSADANAYAYANAFDATQTTAKPQLATRPIPRKERRYIARHPVNFAKDPT
jgi:phospholipase C